MPIPVRLLAFPDQNTGTVRFQVAFAAPKAGADRGCDHARLYSGDPDQDLDDIPTITIESVCAPGPVTWREHRVQDLGQHTYSAPGPHTASLRWNGQLVSTIVTPFAANQQQPPPLPKVSLLELIVSQDKPGTATIRMQVNSLNLGQQVRLDAGAGQIRWLVPGDEAIALLDWTIYYAKPGRYSFAVDLVDAEGFWLSNLAERTLEITSPDILLGASQSPPLPQIEALPLVEVPPATEDSAPWLPHRYCRPLWAGSHTYTAPGGSRTLRSLTPGTHLAIQAETLVGSSLWYQSSYGDWIAASAVTLVQPSQLQGVELRPALLPSPSQSIRQGVVTAARLNVRTRPGVVPNNPPIDQLADGTPVTIYEEQPYAGAPWYRIGDERWVHGGWVQVILSQPTAPGFPYLAMVTASQLNVRARPGVGPDNPPVAQLPHGTRVTCYEEKSYAGVPWYRVGEDRWVHGSWIQESEDGPSSDEPPAPSEPGSTPLPVGTVTSPSLNVRALPGVSSDNPPVDHLLYGSQVTIYEEQLLEGVTWYRIGEDHWVHSGWVELAQKQSSTNRVSRTRPEDRLALPVGWVVSPSLNVRSSPEASTNSRPIDMVGHNQVLPILETRSVDGTHWYRIGADRWVYGQWVAVAQPIARPSAIGSQERWVGVCLSQQTAVAYEGDLPIYAAMVATGLPATPTVQGLFRTQRRVPHGNMSGGGAAGGGYFYLEKVPWICYFYSGYALHAAYWHDAFGHPRSHGCINMSPHDAWWIFHWSSQSGETSPTVYVYWE